MELRCVCINPRACLSWISFVLLLSGFLGESSALDRVHNEDSCRFPALFAFGDSLTDTGNAQAVFPWQHAASLPPYGNTYFRGPRDRFSDGRLLIDFFAQAMGLPMLDPYLRSVGTNFRFGANFATSGATVTNITFLVPYDFPVQVFWLDQFQRKAASQPPTSDITLPSPSDFSKALYVISIGGNDYDAALFFHNMSIPEMVRYVPRVVEETISTLKELYAVGARNMMIINLPPIGCTPELLTILPRGPPESYDSFGCHIAFNGVLQFHNTQLRYALDDLNERFPDATITYVDYYTATYDISTQHEKYNIQNTSYSCCGWGKPWNYNVNITCGQTTMIDGVMVRADSCPEPKVFLNWDGIHPTEAFYKVAARAFLSGQYLDPPNAFAACNFDLTKFDEVSES